MRSIVDKYSLVPGVGVVVFDPGTLMIASLGASAIGGGLSAAGSLASGSAARAAGQAQQQIGNLNAAQSIASSQRKMFDTQEKTRLATSTVRADAGASGVDASIGSPVEDTGQIAQRGSYHALMDLFNGESAASAERYQGDLAEWEGEEKQNASYLAAGGTLASTAGSMTSTYGKFKYPTARGSFGA